MKEDSYETPNRETIQSCKKFGFTAGFRNPKTTEIDKLIVVLFMTTLLTAYCEII
jgi:hypothetical protein